ARRGARRLLGRQQAALRLARRLGFRRRDACRGKEASRAVTPRFVSVRRETRAAQPYGLGRAEGRGGGEVPELDRRGLLARAGIPALPRRHQAAGSATTDGAEDKRAGGGG